MGCSGSKRTKVVSFNGDTTPQQKSSTNDAKDPDVTPQHNSVPKVTFNITKVCDIKFQGSEDDIDPKQVTLNEQTTPIKYSGSSTLEDTTEGSACENIDFEDADDGDANVNKSTSGCKVEAGNNVHINPEIKG